MPSAAPAQTNDSPSDPLALIREQGLTTNSQAMAMLSYLSDVIGARLTGSPNLRRANDWTKTKLESWGLTNAHLEPWGPFGRGWELKHFSAQIVAPYAFPLIGCPQAWSPGLSRTLTGNVVYLGDVTESNLSIYKGKLAGAIVLVSPIREIPERYDPLVSRQTDTNLLNLANATGVPRGPGAPRPISAPGTNGLPNIFRLLAFLQREKAGLAVSESTSGEGGTVFVASALVPYTNIFAPGLHYTPAYAFKVPPLPPQITLAAEDYNRLVRMIRQGVQLKMEVDLKVKFHDEDRMAYDTVAEIPGSDLKDQLVMLGGHLDSWQAATGATDNGAGVAACMEAVRIIEATHLHPRRTIRIGLWTGEEQAMFGSMAYVSNHFGYFPTNSGFTTVGRRSQLVRGPEYDKLSVYFNLDNGAGKIRGIYTEDNEGARAIFRKWFEPFHDLGAETVTLARTGSTDHVSFDRIGLPGFQFIQDPLDYGTRSHHSNEDVFDRIQADDLKQAATILAAFVYNAAMQEAPIPRVELAE
jgi:hypothetical protein